MSRFFFLLVVFPFLVYARIDPKYGDPRRGSFTYGITSIIKEENKVVLEDGSEWEIAPNDLFLLSTIYTQDRIAIVPSYAWFDPFEYVFVNVKTKTKVKSRLLAGPSFFHPSSSWLVAIHGNHLTLQDGTNFCVCGADESLLIHWDINDPIIIGNEDKSWTHFPFILINTNAREFVRATRY